MTARGRLRIALLLVVVALPLVSCGSRRDHAEVVAAAGAVRPGDATTGGIVLSNSPDDAPSTAGAETSAPTGAVGEAGSNGSSGPREQTGGGAASRAGRVTSSGAAASRAAAGSGNRSPVVLGSVGNYSGPAGSTEGPPAKILQAWATTVNQRGGIAGRAVKLIVVDDRGDPTFYRATLQDLVENQKAVAFIGNFASLTAHAGGDYLAAKRVPVLGGDQGNDVWWSNPMYFPFGAANAGVGFANLSAAKQVNKSRKLGTLACQESAGCKATTTWIHANAKALGFDLVYRGEGSLAAPDFTAQCLAARNAGVEVLWVAFDTNSERRIAQACARQGFRPTYLLGSADSTFQSVADFEGAVTMSFGFPFMYDGPETRGYRAAAKRFAPSAPLNIWTSQAWGSGLLLEKLVSDIQGPVTSQAILDRLWALKGETAGGLLPPLTFAKDRPAPRGGCAFVQVMVSGKWKALGGLTPICVGR